MSAPLESVAHKPVVLPLPIDKSIVFIRLDLCPIVEVEKIGDKYSLTIEHNTKTYYVSITKEYYVQLWTDLGYDPRLESLEDLE